MACVTVTADVFADVMQQGGQLEKLSVLDVEAVQSHCRVEQFEGQLGDLAGMGLRPPRAHAQRHDRGTPDRPRVVAQLHPIVAGDARDDDPLAKAPLRHGELAHPGPIHQHLRHGGAGREELRAAGVDARQSPTFVGRQFHR